MYDNWCRLCGKDNKAEISIYSASVRKDLDLKDLITKHFCVTLNCEDKMPKKICSECYDFIKKLVEFIECVKKANEFFYKAINSHNNDNLQMQNESWESVKIEVIEENELIEQSDQLLPSEHVSVYIKTENFDPEEATELIESSKSLSISTSKSKDKQNKRKTRLRPTKITPKNKNNENEVSSSGNCEKLVLQEEINDPVTNSEEKILKSNSKTRQKSKQEKQFECKICNSIFSCRFERKEHIKTIHYNDSRYECTVCHRKFNRKNYLTKHMIVHKPDNKINPCPHCDKKFTKRDTLKTHVRTVHLGEKPFVCELCGKAFGLKGGLVEHLSTHETEQIFACSHCNKKFKNKSGLRAHEDIHSDKNYICPVCNMQFKTRKTLTIHKLVHSNERRHKCEDCGMAFKRLGHLKRHFSTHTGVAPFSCQYCDKMFTDNYNCRLHMDRVHNSFINGNF